MFRFMTEAFHRSRIFGMVILSDFCRVGGNSFGGLEKEPDLVYRTAALLLEEKTVRDKSTLNPSYAAICPNLAYITGQMEYVSKWSSGGKITYCAVLPFRGNFRRSQYVSGRYPTFLTIN